MDEANKSRSPFKEGGMFNEALPLIFGKAKELRKNMTEAEKIYGDSKRWIKWIEI